MSTTTVTLLIAWLLFPFLGAFLAALLPSLARWLTLVCAVSTTAVGVLLFPLSTPWSLELTGPLGVLLQADAQAAPFLLLNGLVALAVLLDTWRRPPLGPFLLLVMVLVGGLNSAFLAVDLVSLYVALEVVGVTAFLLILQKRQPQQLWIALRYLLVSNSVMTLYLVGAALLYLQTESFRLKALSSPAMEPRSLAVVVALLLVGLLAKSGVFLSGLWLPRTHAEAPSEVSALLSGVVVAGGLCPLLRLSNQLPQLQPLLLAIGLASALLGVIYALAETDLKRVLAWSTLGQVGLVIISPVTGGVYALAHGLAKACLFLVAGRAGSRDLSRWRQQPLQAGLAVPLLLASLSIAGAPLLLGYWTKTQLNAEIASQLSPLLDRTLLVAKVGTAAVYARLCWRPIRWQGPWPSAGVGLLLLLLLALGLLQGPLPSLGGALKALAVIAAGVGVHAGLSLVAQALRRRRQATASPAPDLAPGPVLDPPPLPLPLPDLERLQELLGGIAVVGAALVAALMPREALWPG
ncbi:proton-conducting membrane transporter [Cyanobium sp. LEGE 06143]|uniref:proton-conducting transporter transmembrane domain-containing protein n=1 Tax=Cyanobium sp. LEGE 06143 TaxID=945727 RepID=UPI00187E0275|nr:proton-conducting transporter membrane subunit [Cyanobium sp. LEGE 06143]MBE9172751.1 proton-conducting membrane transporter [Cyanobium sp. LEGE 06143]